MRSGRIPGESIRIPASELAPLPPIPDSVLELMAIVGPKWASDISAHIRQMIDVFTPVLALAPKSGVDVLRSINYGNHVRQILDVYQPASSRLSPVVLFVHGGAFVDGERNRSSEIYANVLYYFARYGIVGVNMEYRLAPQYRYPSGIEDVALATQWVHASIERYGGDPARLFLMGHSAGAAHTGSYVYDADFHGSQGPGVAGHIVVSGRVRAETWPGNPNAAKVEAYYGKQILGKHSAVNHVSANSVPTMIAIGEFENPYIDVHCAELFYRIAAVKGRAPRFMRLQGHNHTSMIAHLNTAEERLGRELLAFISNGQ